MEWIVTLISELSQLGGVSGDESRVADYIEEKIRDFADDCRRDRLGNLIAFRKGTDSSKKLMLCAHMDEVGLLVSYITDEGLLRFQPALAQAVLTRPARYNEEVEFCLAQEREGRAIVLWSDYADTIGRFEKSYENIHKLYENGYEKAIARMADIRGWLSTTS